LEEFLKLESHAAIGKLAAFESEEIRRPMGVRQRISVHRYGGTSSPIAVSSGRRSLPSWTPGIADLPRDRDFRM
jgi:hypothetical protein